MDASTALSLLGENSRWHVRTYLFYSLGMMLALPLMIMSPVFIGKVSFMGVGKEGTRRDTCTLAGEFFLSTIQAQKSKFWSPLKVKI